MTADRSRNDLFMPNSMDQSNLPIKGRSSGKSAKPVCRLSFLTKIKTTRIVRLMNRVWWMFLILAVPFSGAVLSPSYGYEWRYPLPLKLGSN
jgi:hypothetical protein